MGMKPVHAGCVPVYVGCVPVHAGCVPVHVRVRDVHVGCVLIGGINSPAIWVPVTWLYRGALVTVLTGSN